MDLPKSTLLATSGAPGSSGKVKVDLELGWKWMLKGRKGAEESEKVGR